MAHYSGVDCEVVLGTHGCIMGRDGVKDDRAGRMRKRAKANGAGKEWWRKLSLPRRGKKDTLHSPAPLTEAQLTRLEKRRAQLCKAISAPRTSRPKHMSIADWLPAVGRAAVRVQHGNSVMSMGDFVDGVQHLRPEEALFLLDRGTLELRHHGRPVSLQHAWALLFSLPDALSVEHYLAYAHLRRAGYVVRRCEVETNLPVTLACWRAGGFKRKDQSRPLFYVAVYSYEHAPPVLSELSTFLSNNAGGKTRVKIALIDRGVVVLTDVANNATPLSDRFKKRYERAKERAAATANEVKNVEMGDEKKAIELQQEGNEAMVDR